MAFANADTIFRDDERDWEAAVLSARAAWLARWPNHCKSCHGAPGDYNPDTDEMEPACAACGDSGRCPRCAAQLATGKECTTCGWDRRPDQFMYTENDKLCA